MNWGFKMRTTWTSQLTQDQKEIFDGLATSDAHLGRCETPLANSYFRLQCKYKGFAEAVKSSLNLNWSPIKHKFIYDQRTKKTYEHYWLNSRRDTFITSQRKRWYPEGKKIVPSDFQVTRLSLLWWYIGDGCLSRKKSRPTYRRIQLAVDCFSEEEKVSLVEKLKYFLKDDNVYRETDGIVISRSGVNKFANIVGLKSPVEEYQYKFDFGQYLDENYFKNNYNKRWSVTQFGERMKKCNSKKVVCRETNQVYASLTEAAKQMNLPLSTLSYFIKRNSAVKGKHYEYKEQ